MATARVTATVAVESEEKAAFRALLDSYKAQNPAKYEKKSEELLAKLNTL